MNCNMGKDTKIAIFCEGELWHGKRYEEYKMKHNRVYWGNKIKRNMEFY